MFHWRNVNSSITIHSRFFKFTPAFLKLDSMFLVFKHTRHSELCFIAIVVAIFTLSFTQTGYSGSEGELDEEVLERIQVPPIVKRMVIEGIFGENRRYFKLIYDSGDFVATRADSLEDLDAKIAVSGVRAAGRWGDTVWALSEDGILSLTDLYNPIMQGAGGEAHHRQTLLLSDTISRLQRSFVSFGVRSSYLAERTLLSDGSFSFIDPYSRQDGRVWVNVDSPETMHVQYTMVGHQEGAIPLNEYFILQLNSDGIPNVIESWSLDADGQPDIPEYQLRVLELETSEESLPGNLLRPDYHFREGFHVRFDTSHELFDPDQLRREVPKYPVFLLFSLALLIPAFAYWIRVKRSGRPMGNEN